MSSRDLTDADLEADRLLAQELARTETPYQRERRRARYAAIAARVELGRARRRRFEP